MATETIARLRTPLTTDGSAQDPVDLLENTLAQLEALLWAMHEENINWCSGEGPRHLANLHWLAADLAREAGELFQMSEMARHAAPENDP